MCVYILFFFYIYIYFFSSPESKKDFLKTVHSILRDKQRRQLMKTESLPPNQQYIPFGGKRLSALKGSRPTINRAGMFGTSDANWTLITFFCNTPLLSAPLPIFLLTLSHGVAFHLTLVNIINTTVLFQDLGWANNYVIILILVSTRRYCCFIS